MKINLLPRLRRGMTLSATGAEQVRDLAAAETPSPEVARRLSLPLDAVALVLRIHAAGVLGAGGAA